MSSSKTSELLFTLLVGVHGILPVRSYEYGGINFSLWPQTDIIIRNYIHIIYIVYVKF